MSYRYPWDVATERRRKVNAILDELIDAPRVRDPALAKLMDSLPKSDPDAEPAKPDMVEVWIAMCPHRHTVPVGVKQGKLDFGPWCGPPLPSEEIVIHVRNVRTNAEAQIVGNEGGGRWTQPRVGTNWPVSCNGLTFKA